MAILDLQAGDWTHPVTSKISGHGNNEETGNIGHKIGHLKGLFSNLNWKVMPLHNAKN